MGHFHRAAAGIDHLERLGRGGSPVHRLHALAKLAVTLLFIALAVSVPQHEPWRLAPFFFYPAVLMPLSGTPYRPLLSRLAAALPFALAAGISNLIVMQDSAFILHGIAVSRGAVAFTALMLKTALCVFAVLILIATTPFTEIAALLTVSKTLRIIGLQIVLTYRYISTLLEEAGDSWTAYMLRSPGAKAIHIKDTGSFLGGLLLRSFDKAERVYYAMKCRGFTGVFHPVRGRQLNAADAVFMLTAGAALVFARLWR